MINYIMFGVCAYVILEVIDASMRMNHGGRFMNLVKFSSALASALYGLYKVFVLNDVIWQDLIWAACIGTYLLSVLMHRITNKFNRRLGD